MREEHEETIGRAITELREQQGWSQRQLAKWVGLDQSAVSRIESGRRRVSAQELQRLAEAFKVSADTLLSAAPREAGVVGAGASLLDAAFAPPAPFSAGAPSIERMLAAPSEAHALYEDAEPCIHPDVDASACADAADLGPGSPSAFVVDGIDLPSLRLKSSGSHRSPLRGMPMDHDLRAATASPSLHGVAGSPAGLKDLPLEVTAVVRDWFELRRLAGGDQPVLAWSTGHSAEGRRERLAHPVQPASRGSLGGDVLYDRVARFWRSELHVEPDDGPLPDLVTLLEDGLGAQIIVARVTDLEAVPAGSERPVCAALTAGEVPFLFVNAARPVLLQRFALAHAFAHLVLGHGDVVDGRVHWSRNNPREAAANDFAEELLAPVRGVERWYERRDGPPPELETMLELGNAFGISAWAALYRSRAARRVHAKQFAGLNQKLRRAEWELLPRQVFLGGLRDTLTHLTPGECLPPGEYGAPAVLRVPAVMRAWAFAAVRDGRLSVERAAACLQIGARELAAQLARLGLE